VGHWSLINRAWFLLIAGCGAVVATIVVAGYGALAARDAYLHADSARQIELSNKDFVVGMVNQETGLRGYINTADPTFLEPYALGQQQVQAALRQLTSSGTDATLATNLDASRAASAAWQAWATQRKASVDTSGVTPNNGSQAAIGKDLFDAFRTANQRVQSVADTEARRAIANASTAQRIGFTLLLVDAILAALILAWLGWILIARTLRPIARLATTARALAAGRTEHVVASKRTDEVGDLSVALAAWQTASRDRDQLFNLSSDLFAIAGFDGIFKTINPAWGEVTGLSTAELTTLPYIDFVHEDDQAATIAEGAKLAGGAKTISFRNRYRCKDGSYKWLDWTAVPAEEEQLIYAVARDVTSQQAADESIRHLNGELQRRVAERDATNKELEAFSYSVSHDLRAPLRAIDGFVKILLAEHSDEIQGDARRYFDLVAANAQQMGHLVDDLLEFSRMGRQLLNTQRLNTSAVARRALEQLQPLLEGRQVELTIGELPPVDGDPTLVQQVFLNLIGNAIKYTEGRVPARIDVGARAESDGEVVFFVRDNGAGFDMQYAHKLFGVFQRLHRSEEYEGTGVGLALVHRIIVKHGGRIWPEAAVGKGATFFFTLGGASAWTAKAAA
jgi:PAS domain S-box-containing protein